MPPPPFEPIETDDVTIRVARALTAFAVVVGVLAMTERWFRKQPIAKELHESRTLTRKIDEYRTMPSDVVFVGDSRVFHGVHPETVSRVVEAETGKRLSAYNFGYGSGYPAAFFMIARRVLESEPPPKLFAVGLSPVMFGDMALVYPTHDLVAFSVRARDAGAMLRTAPTLEEASLGTLYALSRLVAYRPHVLPWLLDDTPIPKDLAGGTRGWVSMGGPVHPLSQDRKAMGRAGGYRDPLHKGRLTTHNDGYLRELVRSLRARGTQVVFFGEPQARQLDVNHGPDSIVPAYLAHVKRLAEELGTEFIDLNDNAAVENVDFVDGDHLSEPGAVRFTAYLTHRVLVPKLALPLHDEVEGCRVVFDFESPLDGWRIDGAAFATRAAGIRGQSPVANHRGERFLSSLGPGSVSAMGTALSPELALDGASMALRVSGGDSSKVAVELEVDGAVVRSARGKRVDAMSVVRWDVSELRGKKARLRVRDEDDGAYGYVSVDDVRVCP